MTRVAAVVVAAGSGVRLGNRSKALVPLAGRPMIGWSLAAIESTPEIDSIVVVVGDHTKTELIDYLQTSDFSKIRAIVSGGIRRQDSVLAGVSALTSEPDLVVIHDAARPLATTMDFQRTIAAARVDGAAIMATPVVDTLKRVADGRIADTVNRNCLWAAQTPQVFPPERLITSLRATSHLEVTDESMLMEEAGIPVVIVEASGPNLKVTYPADLLVAEAILNSRGVS